MLIGRQEERLGRTFCRSTLARTVRRLAAVVVWFLSASQLSAQTNFSVRFDQHRYDIFPGETFQVQILVDPIPAPGLFSYGIRVQFQATNVEPAAIPGILVPAELNFDGPRGFGAVRASGTGFTAAKGTVDLSTSPLVPYAASVLGRLALKDRGRGGYALDLGIFNTLGPTEEVFVDGRGHVLDTKLVFLSAMVNYRPSIEIITPTNGQVVNGPNHFLITSAANDPDGFITRVDYYADMIHLGQSAAPPFPFTWTNPPAGLQALTAVATDNVGAVSTSSVVLVEIRGELCFVVSTPSLGTLRNNFTGRIGMKIVVGSKPLLVTQLGRMFSPGNSRTHTVKLVRVSDDRDVPNGSVSIPMSGGVLNQFVYRRLAVPVTLEARTEYFVATEETNGGDQWRDYDHTRLITTTDAVCLAAVYDDVRRRLIKAGDSFNRSYGPVDFCYSVQELPTLISIKTSSSPGDGGTTIGGGTYASNSAVVLSANPHADFVFSNWTENGSIISTNASYSFRAATNRSLVAHFVALPSRGSNFITSFTLGRLRSDGGLIGMRFIVGSSPISVTALGRYKSAGNERTHLVKLLNADATDVFGAAVEVPMAGGVVGEFSYMKLPLPVVLQTNTSYLLVSFEDWYRDTWYEAHVTTAPVARFDGAGYVWYGWHSQGTSNATWGLVDFRFRTEVPNPIQSVSLPATPPLARTPHALVHSSIALRGAELRITWNSIPGQSYRVQWKSSLGDPDWTDLPDDFSAMGFLPLGEEFLAHHRQRFYRVILAPSK